MVEGGEGDYGILFYVCGGEFGEENELGSM